MYYIKYMFRYFCDVELYTFKQYTKDIIETGIIGLIMTILELLMTKFQLPANFINIYEYLFFETFISFGLGICLLSIKAICETKLFEYKLGALYLCLYNEITYIILLSVHFTNIFSNCS